MQPVEKPAVAAFVQMAGVAKVGHHGPVGTFIQELLRADLDQGRYVAFVAEDLADEGPDVGLVVHDEDVPPAFSHAPLRPPRLRRRAWAGRRAPRAAAR